MNDDFNAPAALAVLQDFTRQVNTLLNEQGPHSRATLATVDQLYRELGGDVLGIVPDEVDRDTSHAREEGLIRLLVKLRAQARASKDWATSDKIRDELHDLGVVLEDRPDGTTWKLR
jgi:cysteinyl-tRNA synthetase